MNRDTLELQDIIRLVKRHARLVALVCFASIVISVLVAINIPKKFKAKAVITIQASYFRQPLVDDFVPGVSDPSEQSAQRQALLRLALSDDFLDQLGDRYRVFRYSAEHPLRVMERELFLKRIEYYSVAPTTFTIAVVAPAAEQSFQMTRDVLQRVLEVLRRERLRNLVGSREAIHAQVQALSLALQGVSSPAAALKNELQRLDTEIRSLTSQYTEQHPDVLRLKKRAEAVQRVLENYAMNSSKTGSGPPSEGAPSKDSAFEFQNPAQEFASPKSQGPLQEVYNDLLKKLNYLSVVLEMERDSENPSYLNIVQQPTIPTAPFFPDKRLMVGFGAFAGLAIAFVLVVFLELRRGTFRSPEHALEGQGIRFLGDLPPFSVESDSGSTIPKLAAPPTRVAIGSSAVVKD